MAMAVIFCMILRDKTNILGLGELHAQDAPHHNGLFTESRDIAKRMLWYSVL